MGCDGLEDSQPDGPGRGCWGSFPASCRTFSMSEKLRA